MTDCCFLYFYPGVCKSGNVADESCAFPKFNSESPIQYTEANVPIMKDNTFVFFD